MCSCKSDTILCISEEFCSSEQVVFFSFGFFSFGLSAGLAGVCNMCTCSDNGIQKQAVQDLLCLVDLYLVYLI